MSQAHGFDAAAFERSLERRIPGARVASVTKFWRGVSRETRGVDLADGRRLVIRRDLPAASVTPTSLRFEYEVYRRLADSPVPTAKALWYEDDAIVHSCDCEALGFDEIMTVPLNPAACAETMLDRLGELLASFQIEAFPAVTEAVEVLRAQAPEDAARASPLTRSTVRRSGSSSLAARRARVPRRARA